VAQDALTRPGTVRCVRLESRATFSDKLGSFGESAPPRPREVAGGVAEEHVYCLRRLLIAWKKVGEGPR
jgi:hypothetical protein